MERYKQPHMDLHPDGEWIRYADHCDAMKRAALSQPRQMVADSERAERIPYLPYLVDRADAVKGHYAIGRWNPAGYREVWNLRRHHWSAFSDDVLTLEQATELLRKLVIPTATGMVADSGGGAEPRAVIDRAIRFIETGSHTMIARDTMTDELRALLAASPADPTLAAASISMSRHSRAMLLNVLWHHQGGSSPVGQPIRALLGIGQHDRMTDEQVAEAKWIDGLLAAPQSAAQEARDAARYRWIAQYARPYARCHEASAWTLVDMRPWMSARAKTFEEAIDAAMSASKEGA